jgi:hypothetical protein
MGRRFALLDQKDIYKSRNPQYTNLTGIEYLWIFTPLRGVFVRANEPWVEPGEVESLAPAGTHGGASNYGYYVFNSATRTLQLETLRHMLSLAHWLSPAHSTSLAHHLSLDHYVSLAKFTQAMRP